ncbi:MAG: NAD(P)/FAD-dependent oxidoreductase [Candidatus Saganbacteria bacterium]|nr:NAD(P)/FAD-dependent oxidoreductase [Candidatus Saganbacteria bacterium]
MIYDLIVIGAGPAGMMAAIRASERGKSVVILEKNDSAGKKLLLCGNRRCNITNAEKDPQLFVSNYMKNPMFMLSMLHNLSNIEVMEFFEKNGVPLKAEPQQRVFPKSNKAEDVLNVLLKKLKNNNTEIIYGSPVKDILRRERLTVITKNNEYSGRNVLIATGGKTKQKTGSTGDGFKIAEKLGHKIVPPKKALYPFEVKETDICRRLNGLSIPDAMIVFRNSSGVIFKERGPLMFANFGLTGPVMINASLEVSSSQLSSLKILIGFFPEKDEAGYDALLLDTFRSNPNKSIVNALKEILPESLPPVLAGISGIDPEKKTNEISKEERKNLVKNLTAMEFTVSSYVMVNKSIVTDGGIDLREIDNRTLESKIVKGLYFAGEVLDIVGKTGGFNLQAAWSTGWTVGEGI